MKLLSALGAIAIALFAIGYLGALARRRELMEKYADEQLVNQLLRGEPWMGQSLEMLRDSLGKPAARDEKVLKTKTKETWKYGPLNKRQFKLKVHLENGEVVGWDKVA